jgi:uncharacterized membrane protein (DUF373 family)
MGVAETVIYGVAGLLLIVAGGFTLVGTAVDVVQGSRGRPITDTGLFLLDRVLLLFMIAELLYTLRVVNMAGRIQVEPFLFVGLIATVRKLIVVAAEPERGAPASDVVIQIGAFGGLTLVLASAIYLLRLGAARS